MGTPCSQNTIPAVPITQKPHLDAADVFSVLYVVHENKDYHLLLGDVVDLIKVYINRNTLNIANVDNTADIDKPISRAQAEEFDRVGQAIALLAENKANKNEVPTLTQFNALVEEVADCVRQTPYAEQIREILEMIAAIHSWTESEINQLIDIKITPIVEAVVEINAELAELPNIYLTINAFNVYVNAMAIEITGINQQINNHETRITAIEEQLGDFVTAKNHQW